MMLFPDSVQRLRRAIAHGHAVNAEWGALARPENHSVRIEINDEGTAGVAKTQIPFVPENDIALELGEFFYQLRACLDCLIYQAASYDEGLDPPTNGEKFEFPICIDAGKFKSNAVNRAPFPKQLRDWLLSVQPYIANDPSHPNFMLAKYLLMLHDLARIDRHRKLHIVGGILFELGVAFDVSPGVVISGIELVPGNILETEDVFLKFRVDGFKVGTPRKIKLKTNFGLQIGIQDFTVPEGSTLGHEMQYVVNAVDYVIAYFKELFGGDTAE